jgi:hypothetical protein
MLVNAGDNGRMLGAMAAIEGEVEFDRWQGKAFAKLIDFSLAQAPEFTQRGGLWLVAGGQVF